MKTIAIDPNDPKSVAAAVIAVSEQLNAVIRSVNVVMDTVQMVPPAMKEQIENFVDLERRVSRIEASIGKGVKS